MFNQHILTLKCYDIITPLCNVKGQYLKIVAPYNDFKLCYPDITIQNPDKEMLYPDYCSILYFNVIF